MLVRLPFTFTMALALLAKMCPKMFVPMVWAPNRSRQTGRKARWTILIIGKQLVEVLLFYRLAKRLSTRILVYHYCDYLIAGAARGTSPDESWPCGRWESVKET